MVFKIQMALFQYKLKDLKYNPNPLSKLIVIALQREWTLTLLADKIALTTKIICGIWIALTWFCDSKDLNTNENNTSKLHWNVVLV